MEPADFSRQALATQGAVLGSHEQLLRATGEEQPEHGNPGDRAGPNILDRIGISILDGTRMDTICINPELFNGQIFKCRGFLLLRCSFPAVPTLF